MPGFKPDLWLFVNILVSTQYVCAICLCLHETFRASCSERKMWNDELVPSHCLRRPTVAGLLPQQIASAHDRKHCFSLLLSSAAERGPMPLLCRGTMQSGTSPTLFRHYRSRSGARERSALASKGKMGVARTHKTRIYCKKTLLHSKWYGDLENPQTCQYSNISPCIPGEAR